MNDSWRHTVAIGLAFLLAIAGVALFASRVSRRVHQMHQGSEPIHGWMSIPYIAHSHHVPPAVLFQAIGVQPLRPRDRRSVRRLARELHRTVPDLIAQLQRAIDAAHSASGGQPQ